VPKKIASDLQQPQTDKKLPFSSYVTVGDWVYLSGVVGRDPNTGSMNCQSIREQTLAALGVVDGILREAGACLHDIVKVALFVTDLSLFDDVNQAYREILSPPFPARTCVEISRLPDPEAKVEIDVIAHRQQGDR